MATTQISLPVIGMSCASCTSTVERALKNLDGVEEVGVNLGAGRASVSFDPRKVDVERLTQTVEEVGYEVPSAEVSLHVGDMTCASCVNHVEKALLRRGCKPPGSRTRGQAGRSAQAEAQPLVHAANRRTRHDRHLPGHVVPPIRGALVPGEPYVLSYTEVAKAGGAIWVFLLGLIVSMPLVTSAVKRRISAREAVCDDR